MSGWYYPPKELDSFWATSDRLNMIRRHSFDNQSPAKNRRVSTEGDVVWCGPTASYWNFNASVQHVLHSNCAHVYFWMDENFILAVFFMQRAAWSSSCERAWGGNHNTWLSFHLVVSLLFTTFSQLPVIRFGFSSKLTEKFPFFKRTRGKFQVWKTQEWMFFRLAHAHMNEVKVFTCNVPDLVFRHQKTRWNGNTWFTK